MKNLVDTHLHLYDEKFDENRNEIIEDAIKNLDFLVNISCDYESFLKCLKYNKKYKIMYSTLGYHPVDIKKYNEKDMISMLELSKDKNNKIVAIGEIGLDYYWMEDEPEIQKKYFKKQLDYALEYNLPVVIHTREALKDTLDILREYKKIRGILHCFPGSYDDIKDLLDRFYIGIGGTSTFKNNNVTRELIGNLDLENIVIETDSPYLTPVPFRGKQNRPTYTKYVAEKIAEIKNIDVEKVKEITTLNAMRIYNICLK